MGELLPVLSGSSEASARWCGGPHTLAANSVGWLVFYILATAKVIRMDTNGEFKVMCN